MKLFRPERIPPWAPALLSRLFSCSALLQRETRGGETITLHLFHPKGPSMQYGTEFRWGDESGWIYADRTMFMKRSEFMGGMNLNELPASDAHAIFNVLLEDLSETLEQLSGERFQLTGKRDENNAGIKADTVDVGFRLSHPARPGVEGVFRTGPGTLGLLSTIAEKHSVPADGNDFSSLPLLASFITGHALLNIAELTDIGTGDIIFATPYEETVLITIAGKVMFTGKRTESGRIEVTERRKSAMDDMNERIENTQSDGNDSGSATDLSELPVKLEFRIGEAEITLGELQKIKSGYVFETQTPVESPVFITVNGVVAGTGEIVEIDGRTGIRVKEFAKNGYF